MKRAQRWLPLVSLPVATDLGRASKMDNSIYFKHCFIADARKRQAFWACANIPAPWCQIAFSCCQPRYEPSSSSSQLRVGEAGPETACSYRPETPPRRTLAAVGTMPAMAKPRATYGAWLPNSIAMVSPRILGYALLCGAVRCAVMVVMVVVVAAAREWVGLGCILVVGEEAL